MSLFTTIGNDPDTGFSLNHVKRLVDGLIDAAVVVDRDLHPLVWNTAYMRVSGLKPRLFNGIVAENKTHCCELLNLEVCNHACLAKRCFETCRPVRMDEIQGTSVHSKDKNIFIVSSTPIFNDHGEAQFVLEAYRDVTAEARIQSRYRALLEQERKRSENLEELVRERTSDLQRSMEELRNTRSQLIRSEKLSSLGQVIAGIAHEINNPINFIYGNTDFLESYVQTFVRLMKKYEQCELNSSDREAIAALKQEVDYDYILTDLTNLLRSIRNGAERAAGIIRDLRAFIHGRPNNRVAVDLVTCINQTLTLLAHETKNRIQIKFEQGENLPKILCNEGQLNQVFMNLLMNAVQAVQGTGTITISFAERDGGVSVGIQDSGIGIPEDHLLKVFDPFFTTKPVGQGTGLGLSLSYSIVDAHGGKLSVTSEVGKGSLFTVWLPLSPLDTDEASLEKKSE